MEIENVLERARWPIGKQGRTSCPLHLGKNPTAFSYRGGLWHCFHCGKSGNAHQLADILLGPRPTLRAVPGLEAFGATAADTEPIRERLLPSARLHLALEERRGQRADRARLSMRFGSELIGLADRLHAAAGGRAEILDVAAEAVWLGMAEMDRGLRGLGEWW